MTPARQTAIGLTLAAALVLGWAGLHAYGVFLLETGSREAVLAPLLVLTTCWLNVGLFIVAHDAMHGSLAPGRPMVNRWIGRLVLFLYAGFSYDRLRPKHFEHHRRPGTAEDPDYAAEAHGFWRWYLAFLRQYFGLRELAVLTLLVALYVLLLGAPYPNLLLFWALPAILSSLQLFYFGTYRPHRAEGPFADTHRARSNDYGWLASLLTCFHFGYHLEHHRSPWTPWWRLPALRIKDSPR